MTYQQRLSYLKQNLHTRFRLHPENKSLYFSILIWKNRKSLRHWNRYPDIEGICREFKRVRVHRNGTTRTSPEVGHVHLHIRALGIGIVTHELTHAALAYLRRLKINLTTDYPNDGMASPTEEHLCHITGNLAAQFVTKAYQKGIYKDTVTVTTQIP